MECVNILANISSFIYEVITNLRGEQIALLSIFITFVIYVLGKFSELNLKKYESKKQQYIKLIELLEKMFTESLPTDTCGNPKLTPQLKKQFFNLGSSLLLYGSKKLYKQYIFYRELSSNQLIQNSKYFSNEITMYIMADMLTTIRKEVGLNKLDSITDIEALGFFVNDVANNPFSKIKSYQAHYRIKMIKLELFLIDRVKFVYMQKLFNYILRPIGGILKLLYKYFFLIPLGILLVKIFPNIQQKLNIDYIKTQDIENKI